MKDQSNQFPLSNSSLYEIFFYVIKETPQWGGFVDWHMWVGWAHQQEDIYQKDGTLPDSIDELHSALLECAQEQLDFHNFYNDRDKRPKQYKYPRALMAKIIEVKADESYKTQSKNKEFDSLRKLTLEDYNQGRGRQEM